MAANTTPIFGLAGKIGSVTISTANTNRDGTGTIGVVFTAGTEGSRIDRVEVKAVGTTTAGMVRLYVYTGSVYYLADEVSVSAITPSATVQSFVAYSGVLAGILLPTGYSIRASTHNAESFNVIAYGEDF